MKIRVFNADDHPMLLKGIKDMIIESENLEWVGSADNGKDALDKIRNIKPDIAILDIEMPHKNGLEVAKTLIDEGVTTQFILLTLFKDENFLTNALDLGIKGYLLKESSEKEIKDCIISVYNGKPYVNSSLTHILLNTVKSQDSILSKLSDHEINIVKLIARQKTSNEIANMLFISAKTVGNHRSNISKKLGLTGEQNGLLKWAMENKNLFL